jgi:hypothetical protein
MNLLDFQKSYTSQYGEDGIIEKIFELIPDGNHWCVEFGAWDGKRFSNTYHLISEKSWRGVLIEGSRKKFKDLLNTYSGNKNVIFVNKFITFDGKNTLDNILKESKAPADFDLLSIDIDGNDFHIWKSLTNFNPKCIIIEFNPFIPDDIEYVQPSDPTIFRGSSLLALCRLAKEKGYELIAVNHENAFFIDKKYYPLFDISDNNLSSMRVFKDSIRVFPLFDGTLVFNSSTNLVWHELKMDFNKLQPLPKYFRNLPWTRYDNTLNILIKRILFKIYLLCRRKRMQRAPFKG